MIASRSVSAAVARLKTSLAETGINGPQTNKAINKRVSVAPAYPNGGRTVARIDDKSHFQADALSACTAARSLGSSDGHSWGGDGSDGSITSYWVSAIAAS